MTRVLYSTFTLIFAAMVAFTAPTSAQAAEVTFKQKPIGKGVTIDQKTEMSFEMAMKMTMPDGNGMNMDMKMSDIEDKQVRVLAVDSQGPKELSVMYRDRGASQTMFGQVSAEPSPVKGNTYSIVRGKSGITSTPEVAGPAKDEVFGELEQLDDLMTFVATLETSTIPVGQTVDLATLQKSGLLGAGPAGEAKLESGSLTLKETRVIDGANYGVFDIKMRMVGDDANTGLKMAMDMNGEILIDTDTGWMRSLLFTGPVSMNGTMVENGLEMNMSATGSFRMSTEARYAR